MSEERNAEPADQLVDELRRAAADLRTLVTGATPADLARGSAGTRWTNAELLWHMVFGYLLAEMLTVVVIPIAARLPRPVGLGFAALLDAGSRPFHVVNYVGSVVGARVVGTARTPAAMDWVAARLIASHASMDARRRGLAMPFPLRWDPYFTATMTTTDVLHYATVHYRHHRGQLTLAGIADAHRAPGTPTPP